MSYVAPTIGIAGLTIPLYQDILDYLIAQKKNIYGNDIYLGEDSTDYQELSTFALMIFDTLQTLQLVYNNRGPASAIGAALDSIVKLNGLVRNVATNSTVDVTITGTPGTTITNGIVKDQAGNKWDLPASVVIPPSGWITETATAEEVGAITATANTVNIIFTPVAGWISVNNTYSSGSPSTTTSVGQPVETDAALRARQAISTAIPSLSILEGIAAAIGNLTGVGLVKYYENKTDATEPITNIPSHSVAFVIEGGDSVEIATILAEKMTPGTGFYGDVEEIIYDDYGIPTTVYFSRPTIVTIDVAITIVTTTGYTDALGALIAPAIVAYINSLGIGVDVLYNRVIGAALLLGVDGNTTFNITSLKMAVSGSSPYDLEAADILIDYNEAAYSSVGHITLTVV